jgi:N-carbamoyl-L-amino-acid hydrolase
MHLRRDAMVAAARIVLTVRRLGFGPAAAATVGRLEAKPGVGNVIAGEVELSFDVRAADDRRCDAAIEELRRSLGTIGAVTNTSAGIEALLATPAVHTDDRLRDMIACASNLRDLRNVELPSGAGHDCGHMARLGPIAMIFVPSTGGVSHHPSETSPPDALVAGAAVLLDVLVRADEVFDV